MKSRLFLISAILLVVTFSGISQQVEPVDLDIIHKIKMEEKNHSMIPEFSFFFTDFVGPRLPNSTNGRKAQEVALKKMKEIGLENIHREKWGEFGRGWNNERTYIAMTEPYYSVLIGSPRAWTPGTDKLVSGKVVLTEINKEEDFEKYRGKLEGKIVILPSESKWELSFEPLAQRYTDDELLDLEKNPISAGNRRYFSPADLERYRAMRAMRQKVRKFLVEEKALAVLSTSGFFGTPRNSGASASPEAPETLPEIILTGEHHGRIIRLIQHDVPVLVELDIRNTFTNNDLNDYNIIGEIPGTDNKLKDQVVMVGAHLDSWHMGTGANDNASGCIVMMEAMRILKALNIKPRRTIRIALWGAEEQGLLGSRGYVKKHFADRNTMKLLPEHAGMSVYFNVDNGSGKIRGIYLQGNDRLRPVFESWFKPFKDMGVQTITLRNTGGTDHLSFDAVGLNGFQFIQDRLDYRRGYHTNMDVYERMEQPEMMHNAVIVAALVYHAAMRNDLLPRKPLPEPRQSNR